jgi:hypothetical protein
MRNPALLEAGTLGKVQRRGIIGFLKQIRHGLSGKSRSSRRRRAWWRMSVFIALPDDPFRSSGRSLIKTPKNHTAV